MSAERWIFGRRAALAAFISLVAVAAGLGLQSSSAGTSTKPYTAAMAPGCTGAGGTTTLTLTLTNGSSNQSLGSANLTAPTGESVSSSDSHVDQTQSTPTLIALRNLSIAAKSSASYVISVTTPASATGTLTWGIRAKQSNDFNGTPGNDFTLSGGFPTTTIGCSLVFEVPPTSAVQNQTITEQPYNPAGPAVSVKVVDGLGHTVTDATGTVALTSVGCVGFSGNDAVALSQGAASFGSLKSSTYGFGCKLRATSSAGYTAATSDSFNISLVGTLCGTSSCPQLSSSLDSDTQLTTSASGGSFTFIAFSPVTISPPAGACTGFSTLGVSGFDEVDGYVTGTGTKTFRYFVSKAAYAKKYSLTSGQQFIPICAGGERVVNGQRLDCHIDGAGGWMGKTLDSSGNFLPGLVPAFCASDGMWWGILPSFQDYTTKDGKKVDWSKNPSVTGWGSTTDSRYFDMNVPSPWDWRAGT